MKEVLKVYGVVNYLIFLDEKMDILFVYVEVEDKVIYDKIVEIEIC